MGPKDGTEYTPQCRNTPSLASSNQVGNGLVIKLGQSGLYFFWSRALAAARPSTNNAQRQFADICKKKSTPGFAEGWDK